MHRIALLIAMAISVSGCDLLKSWSALGSGGRGPRPPWFGPAPNSGLTILDKETIPIITENRFSVTVSVPEGLHATIDTRELLDVDNNFQPVGEAQDVESNKKVIVATIKGLFSMAYYDLRKSTLNQEIVDRYLQGVKFSKPVWIAVPSKPGYFIIDTLILSGNRLLGVAAVTQHEDGHLDCGGTEFANAPDSLPPVSEIYPALTKGAAYHAMNVRSPAFSLQSSSGVERVHVRSQLLKYNGLLDFYWNFKSGGQRYLIESRGEMFSYQLPYAVQSLEGVGTGKLQLDSVGYVGSQHPVGFDGLQSQK